MSSKDSSGRRSGPSDAGSDTPIGFYVMMGAMALAILFFLYALLFM